MALLQNMDSLETTVLLAHHVVGRNDHACKTVIDAEDVSRSHATLYWSQDSWFLQDHSRNGSLLDGVFLRQATAKLAKDAILQFGNASGTRWRLIDDAAPCSYIQRLGTEERLMLDACRALPDEVHPEVLFYQDQDLGWRLEGASGKLSLANGQHFTVGEQAWEFMENEPQPETKEYGQIAEQAQFIFHLSANEEDIHLLLEAGQTAHDLGRRTYNFMLLTLARKRLADVESRLALADQGWISIELLERQVGKELAREVDMYYLNLQVFRLRKQLMELKPFGHLFSQVIERRPGEIRFAFPYLKVIQEDQVIAEIRPNAYPSDAAAINALVA